jgi:hypothetical protein
MVASESAIGTFSSVKKRAALSGVVALVIGSVLCACASSKEEGVVTEPPEGVTAPAAHFGRPTYNPGDTGMTGREGFGQGSGVGSHP